MRTASITIDSAALRHNLQQVSDKVPSTTKILAMVKADAYGHGLENCLPALQEADALGVAFFEEAQAIRALGWDKDVVLIEGGFSETEWHQSLQANFQSVIHQHNQVNWALKHQPQVNTSSRTIWLKVNSGMNRLGFEPEDVVGVAKKLVDCDYRIILTSHFANADCVDHPNNANQINIFTKLLNTLRTDVDATIQASLCNSAGIINFPDCHFDWVRPGIMLYGCTPLDGGKASDLNLKPVMTFESKIMAIQKIEVGSCVGYGSQFIASKPMLKGVVSVGYGDGYPRSVNELAWVSLKIADQRFKCPIIGRVSMDMIAIDLTDVLKSHNLDLTLQNSEINTTSTKINKTIDSMCGRTVTLWGDGLQGEPTVDDIAASAQTIGYELLCRITQRPLRHVI